MDGEAERIAALRDRLWAGLLEIGGVWRNGSAEHCIAGALNVAFEGVEGESLMLAMKDLALSSGSACNSASIEPSHVLRGIGLPEARAFGSLRFSLGRFSTAEEIELAIGVVARAVLRLRGTVSE